MCSLCVSASGTEGSPVSRMLDLTLAACKSLGSVTFYSDVLILQPRSTALYGLHDNNACLAECVFHGIGDPASAAAAMLKACNVQ